MPEKTFQYSQRYSIVQIRVAKNLDKNKLSNKTFEQYGNAVSFHIMNTIAKC